MPAAPLASLRTVVAGVAASVAIAAGAAVPATAAAKDLPVPWSPVGMVAGGVDPDSAAGANDFGCRPSEEHPNPVVLVHGLIGTLGTNWPTMSPLLANNGFCVFGLSYGRIPGLPMVGGLGPMERSAEELRAFIDRVLRETGADKVDLVGHSEGTVMPRWYLSFLDGAAKVDKYVQITPLWDGTNLVGLGDLLALAQSIDPAMEDVIGGLVGVACGSCAQFMPSSSYMRAVNDAGRPVPGITYTSIVTKYDELVSPYTSGILEHPQVTNHVLQDVCPNDFSEHMAVAYDPNVAQMVLNALSPDRARPVPCVPMTPAGPLGDVPPIGLAPAKSTGRGGTSGRDGASGTTAGSAASRCSAGKAIRVRVRRGKGERIRRITVTRGKKRLAVRRGKALRSVVVRRLAPGRRSLRVRTVGKRRDGRTVRRNYVVRRTVRC
ncbi:MAG: alpha/beta fold hydrolase [Solirubrobacteraceae bacterium]|nr:alpha/beta fold hydrolase [Solirubrobacteraceae bacterium]